MEAHTDNRMLRLLAPMAAQAGVELPGGQDIAPMINLDEQVIRLAEQFGGLLARCEVYQMNSRIVTVEDGKITVVTKDRFCTLVEEFVTTVKFTAQGPKPVTMGKDLAAKIMESRQFTYRLPEIHGVVPVRVPVKRENGTVELLPKGYDAASKVYCLDEVKYDETMRVGPALLALEDYFSEFQFATEESQGDPAWRLGNRSFTVQLVSMLNSYCRLMLPAGTPKPMFVWVANQQGSGKSVLAEAAIAPVYGDVATVSTPETKKEFSQLLDTTAQAMFPYLFIDDAPTFVASGALNRFVTSRRHAGRILGTPLPFDVPNVTTVLLTGNNLELTPDLMRRALVVELFVPGDIETRTFKRQIEPGYWSRPEVRGELLAAMWAVVRHYVAEGEQPGPTIKPTFEAWSLMIGGMIAALPDMGQGRGDPMRKAELPMSGDRRGAEWRQLLAHIAGEIATDDMLVGTEDLKFTTKDIVTAARQQCLLDDVCGVDGDKELTGKELRNVGRELRRWRGRELVDSKGRRFQFGQRHQRRGSEYPLVFM